MDQLIVAGKPLQDLKVTELKDELGKRSLSKSGNKLQLCSRLGEYLLANPEGEPERIPEEPARKGSPPKSAAVPAVGDSIISQYLAERESMLAESLDHKRKVQAAEPRELEESPPKDVPKPEIIPMSKPTAVKSPPRTEHTMTKTTHVAAPPAEEEEEIAAPLRQTDFDSSRRKGRKPELRRSTRASDKGAEEEEEPPESLIKPADSVSAATSTVPAPALPATSESPVRITSPVAERKVKSPSPRKEDLGSQAVVANTSASPLTNSGSGSTVVVDENEKIKSNAKMVSRGKVEDEKAVEAPVETELTDGKTTPLEAAKLESLPPVTSEPAKSVDTVSAAAKEATPMGRESPSEKKSTRSTRNSGVKSPSPGKDTVGVQSPPPVTGSTVKLPVAVPTGTATSSEVAKVIENKSEGLPKDSPAVNSHPTFAASQPEPPKVVEKDVPQLPRKLTESLSVEDEKLDYGEIEPEDDVAMKDEPPLPRPESPRGQKRRQSTNLGSEKVSTTSSDKRDDVLKARSEKFGTVLPVLPEHSKEIKEPPRKMARSGFTAAVVKDDSSQPVTPATSHGNSTSPPPSRNPTSRMLHIRNLVRPYSLPQLKDLLRKTGSILDDVDHFWIDVIKSQCVVTYTTIEEAEASRKALYNSVWPSSNPQKLVVDFVREEDFKERTTAASTPAALLPSLESRRPPGTTTSSSRPHIDRPAVEKLKITVANNKETGEAHRDVATASLKEKRLERQAERDSKQDKDTSDGRTLGRTDSTTEKAAEREWDRGKSQPINKEIELTPTKPVGTDLELLFQKTETRPCLYWKPLSDDEVKLREEDELKSSSARDERRKQFDQERLQRDRDESKAGFDRPRRDSSRDRRIGGPGGRRDSSPARNRSRSRGRGDRGFRGGGGSSGGRPGFNRRNNSPYRRRRTPSPKFRSGGGRRSRSNSRGRRN